MHTRSGLAPCFSMSSCTYVCIRVAVALCLVGLPAFAEEAETLQSARAKIEEGLEKKDEERFIDGVRDLVHINTAESLAVISQVMGEASVADSMNSRILAAAMSALTLKHGERPDWAEEIVDSALLGRWELTPSPRPGVSLTIRINSVGLYRLTARSGGECRDMDGAIRARDGRVTMRSSTGESSETGYSTPDPATLVIEEPSGSTTTWTRSSLEAVNLGPAGHAPNETRAEGNSPAPEDVKSVQGTLSWIRGEELALSVRSSRHQGKIRLVTFELEKSLSGFQAGDTVEVEYREAGRQRVVVSVRKVGN